MSDYADTTFYHPARIMSPYAPEERDQLLDLIREHHAYDPDSINPDDLFLFPGEISSERLDSYFTHMLISSLQNYAEDSDRGISLQNSHKRMELGFGRSVRGVLEESPEDGAIKRVRTDFYVIPGLRLNGLDTDDLIMGVRTGIVKDLSIGFYGGSFLCDVCGRDLLTDWDCPHVPGLTYENEETGEEVVATAGVDGARLSEVSTVYDGATPGAAVIKARQEADGGRLRPEQARVLEARYRIRLNGAQHFYQGVDLEKRSRSIEEDKPMANETELTFAMAADRLRSEFDRFSTLPDGEPGLDSLINTIRQMSDALEQARQETSGLRVLADIGRQYRADLVSEALEEGVRAHGEEFDQETYRALLESETTSLETIKRFRADWKRIGDQTFSGGRKTTEESDGPSGVEDGRWVDPTEPVSAYRA